MSATIVEAVVKLATKVKGETVKPANATIAAALDALADALAGENVQAKPTIASAIDVITENYTPGGGGDVDVGALVAVFVENEEPTVGGGTPGADGPLTVAIGDTVIASGNVPGIGASALYGSFAAGMTAQTNSYVADTLSAYACTIGDDGEGNAVYLTVAPYALEATRTSDEGGYSWTFVIPEMSEGVALVLYPHTAS